MEFILNEELITMVNNGSLNMSKIHCLISVKEFIDRISTSKYLEDHIIEKIEQKYNTRPAVTSWGDYFQTELAYDLQFKSDEDFYKAVDTVKYDIMSSYEIFANKNDFFFEWVENNYNEMESGRDNVSEEEYEEAFHLNILKDYYSSMKITDKFTKEERCWYNNFKDAKAV
ncbi:MAG: hypothetical protein JW864_06285 [Spirochaetes bacterium]|nr:hypothetical protein [Spirochaetota bacterium]